LNEVHDYFQGIEEATTRSNHSSPNAISRFDAI